MQVTCVSQAHLLESSLMKILLNRRLFSSFFFGSLKLWTFVRWSWCCRTFKVKGATACTARPSVCDDLTKRFIDVGNSLKMSPNPATFGTLGGGRRKGIVGHVGTGFRHGGWQQVEAKRAKVGREGFLSF